MASLHILAPRQAQPESTWATPYTTIASSLKPCIKTTSCHPQALPEPKTAAAAAAATWTFRVGRPPVHDSGRLDQICHIGWQLLNDLQKRKFNILMSALVIMMLTCIIQGVSLSRRRLRGSLLYSMMHNDEYTYSHLSGAGLEEQKRYTSCCIFICSRASCTEIGVARNFTRNWHDTQSISPAQHAALYDSPCCRSAEYPATCAHHHESQS